MTKDEVMKFLDTASPEVFSEIRARMTEIVRDRDFQKYLARNKARTDRTQRICELHKSGMTFKELGELYNISRSRCQQIYQKEMRKLKYKGLYEFR